MCLAPFCSQSSRCILLNHACTSFLCYNRDKSMQIFQNHLLSLSDKAEACVRLCRRAALQPRWRLCSSQLKKMQQPAPCNQLLRTQQLRAWQQVLQPCSPPPANSLQRCFALPWYFVITVTALFTLVEYMPSHLHALTVLCAKECRRQVCTLALS